MKKRDIGREILDGIKIIKKGQAYLRKRTVQKAIDSFGSWEESSVEIVNKLRSYNNSNQ